MSAAKGTLKQKAVHELREYCLIALYLFVVFSLLIIHTSLVLAEHHINYVLHGFALINALALAKVMLAAQNLHLAEQFEDAPLIYTTLLKAFAFTVVLACFKIAEDTALGRLHGRSLHESLAEFGGGTLPGVLIVMSLVFVMLIPFFGFTELRRVFGSERMIALFFRSRHLWRWSPEQLNEAPTKKLA